MAELWELNALDLAAVIRNGEASAGDAVESCIKRIDAVNVEVNAVTVVYADEARAAAAAADAKQAAGGDLGPLHGVPLGVKENIDVQGWPTTWGVPAFAEAFAPQDAPIVAQLREAGAIPVAATNLPDFALRWHTDSSLRGATRNPWAEGRTAGGSSGGSAAALATGMVPLALGNDLGGSLRVPAQFCGVSSVRPSHGRIARASATMRGELPISFQLMYVEGPMARSPGDLRAALASCCGFDARDPWWVPAPLEEPAGDLPTVAVSTNPGGMGVNPQVADGVRKAAAALADAGYPLEEADPPDIGEALQTWQRLLFNEVRVMMFETIEQLSMPDAPNSLKLCEPFVPALNQEGLVRAFAERTRLFRDWLEFFQRYPLLLGPVSTEPPFSLGADLESTGRSKQMMDSMRLVVAVNLMGLPVSVVPAGVAEGLPQAVQVIGPPFSEARCLQAGAAIDAALGAITPIDPR